MGLFDNGKGNTDWLLVGIFVIVFIILMFFMLALPINT